ncbi:hypothetical protein ACFVTX_17705 [Agromyces sp. NPDC058136]|uniref:hypothetical protein n=1 Tax=Agromyces sp. NPDC058136 TaxID=3346354 RepID=UPI0036DB1CFD
MATPIKADAALTGRSASTRFWVFAAWGILTATGAWLWYGLAQFESQSEQCKALAAGTTMAGFGELTGGIPLVLLHLLGLGALVPLGWRQDRWDGVMRAVIAVLVASVIGIGITQILLGGELFQLGVNNVECYS